MSARTLPAKRKELFRIAYGMNERAGLIQVTRCISHVSSVVGDVNRACLFCCETP
jgi:hypothetical protein